MVTKGMVTPSDVARPIQAVTIKESAMLVIAQNAGLDTGFPRLINEDLIELAVRLLKWIFYQLLSQWVLQW